MTPVCGEVDVKCFVRKRSPPGPGLELLELDFAFYICYFPSLSSDRALQRRRRVVKRWLAREKLGDKNDEQKFTESAIKSETLSSQDAADLLRSFYRLGALRPTT